MTSLWTVNTVLTILKVRRGGLEDGEEGPTTLPEATALSAYTLPVPALNWACTRGGAAPRLARFSHGSPGRNNRPLSTAIHLHCSRVASTIYKMGPAAAVLFLHPQLVSQVLTVARLLVSQALSPVCHYIR